MEHLAPARADLTRQSATMRAHTVIVLCACMAVLVASCAVPAEPDSDTGTTDWCWRYYALAPAGALISDLGPPSADAVDEWLTWLHATLDAPTDRRRAQSEQLHLVDRIHTSQPWTSAERDSYRRASISDPTPATLCETRGARTIPHHDGTLPDGWTDRFVDPDDPAFSQAAWAESEAAR